MKSDINIIRDKRGLQDLASEWDRLAGPLENPLMNHEWFMACARTFYEEGELHIVTVQSRENIAAIAPLAITRTQGRECLELVGVPYLHEPCGLLYDSRESLERLIKEVIKLRQPLLLNRIPADDPTSKLFRECSKYRGLIIERNTSLCIRVHITTRWSDYVKSLSSRRRYDLRRARKRAEERGDVSFKISCPAPDELNRWLDMAFQVESESWKGRNGSALLYNHKIQQFFRKYANLASRDSILRIGFMFINDEVAAMQIAIEYAQRFWVLKIGYDEKWAKCSPGIQLTHESIRYAFNHGLKSYEFLGSDEPWLHMWSKDKADYTSVGMYPLTFKGLYGLGIDLTDYARRKILTGFVRRRRLSAAI